jgi:hypothetical protein
MSSQFDKLTHYCSDPKKEIDDLKDSFSQIISLSGPSSYRPRLALFDKSLSRVFAVAARPYVDASDFKATVAEMLYSYSAFHAESCILVLDSNIVTDSSTKDCLNLYFMSNEYCHVVQLIYQIEDNNVLWDDSDIRIDSIDLKEHDYVSQEMVETMYIYTHLDDSPFLPKELLSYYSFANYQFRTFKELNISYVDFSTFN